MTTPKTFSVGDTVITRHGETGVIEKPWEHNDDSYHWWVKIEFEAEGRKFTTKMPFINSDLRMALKDQVK